MLFLLCVSISGCVVNDEPPFNQEPSIEVENLIKETSDYTIYQIGIKHSWISKLFRNEMNLTNEIRNLGKIDLNNIYLLKRNEMYVLQVGILRSPSPGKFEEAALVAVSTVEIEGHFIHYTIARADLANGEDQIPGYENFNLEVLSGSDLAVPYQPDFEDVTITDAALSLNNGVKVSSMAYHHEEDTCVEEYYAEMRDECLEVMACDIACTLLLQACRLEWAAVASARCFWDWYYGVEYFAPEA